MSIAAAAGGIVSNAVDMAKYLQFHLNKGKVGDVQILAEVRSVNLKSISMFQIINFFGTGFCCRK